MKLHFPTNQYGFVEQEFETYEDLKNGFVKLTKVWQLIQEELIQKEFDEVNSKLPLGRKSALSK